MQLSERGQGTQEFSESSEGAVSRHYIVYAPQAQNDNGDVYDDPDSEYVIDSFYVTVVGTGTIQFFKEDVETEVAEELTPSMPVDDVHSPHRDDCIWRPGPKHDVYYTTTGAVDVTVRLKTHVVRRGLARGVEINP